MKCKKCYTKTDAKTKQALNIGNNKKIDKVDRNYPGIIWGVK